MPSTYNGIGTHYYGKNNIQRRQAPCPHCGRGVELVSYDTRLWFVVVFIPVVPLGRKRIVDYCPSCTRHYAMDLDKWETARQLEVSGAMEKFRSNPTPEGAVAAHQQLLHFHQAAEAAEFQKTMVGKFPDNAKVHAYLGAAMEHIGQPDQAADAYRRALALRPDLPEARVGVAKGYIRSGQLGEARKLLDFLEKSGASQLYSLEPLEMLARAYQSVERHQEALDLFGKIVAELPRVAEVKGFRDLVKKSEKALGRGKTILPKQKFSWKRFFQVSGGQEAGPQVTWRSLMGVGVILALIALGFAISNEYIRRHRTLYLVNGYGERATVRIAGAGEMKRFRGVCPLTLPEGHYHAVVSGPVQQEIDFEVRSGYFDRWFGDPLWLLNVGGGALLVETVATYSRDPRPARLAFHFGQPFERIARVTHPFKPLPESVQVKSGETRTLIELELFRGDATDVLGYLHEKRGPGEALTFAENWLRVHPEDSDALRIYTAFAERDKQNGRVTAFLQTGLTNRPLRIAWHRDYQNLCNHPDTRPALVAQYDEWLRNEPTNAALLYLRGRIEADRAAACRYFESAVAGDPQNPFPLFALGYSRMAAGNWAEARPYFARAVELDPAGPGFRNCLVITRFALGEAALIEPEMRKQLAGDPADLMSAIWLVDSLVILGQPDAAREVSANFQIACRKKYGTSAQKLTDTIRYHTLYAIGDLAGLEKAAADDNTPSGREVLVAALIEQGRMAEAAQRLSSGSDDEDQVVLMVAMAVACRQAGQPAEAEKWQGQMVAELQKGNEDFVAAARLFRPGAAPDPAAVQEVNLPPRMKAVLIALLSQQYPEHRSELATLARRLNVERNFPFHLVRRVTAEAR